VTNSFKLVIVAALAIAGAGCGDIDNGRSPSRVIISSLEGATGSEPGVFTGTLMSDVLTQNAILNDFARITMQLTLRDPGVPGLSASPTPLNQVTFTRYRVQYTRADGRNVPGVDVPHPFDSAVTVTVPADGPVSVGFELVRHAAKLESPLIALRDGGDFINTITTVTFYGKDQAGNDVTVSGNIGVNFGNFADPS
jgi:hypothetical protein